MNKYSLFGKVRLYQKTLRVFEDGTKGIHWQDLGSISAHLYPYKTPRGSIYDVTVPHDSRVFSTDKILWNGHEYFMMHIPRAMSADSVKMKIFSWSHSHDLI